MGQLLTLKNNEKQIIRTMPWHGDEVFVIQEEFSKRIRICSDPEKLNQQGKEFTVIKTIDADQLKSKKSIQINDSIHLQLVGDDFTPLVSLSSKESDSTLFKVLLALFLIIGLGFYGYMSKGDLDLPTAAEENKTRLVKIIKSNANIKLGMKKKPSVKKSRVKNLNKLGALAAFGSMTKSRFSGIKVSSKVVSNGPGHGGRKGSGGVQSSIFAKGLLSASLGAGNKINGLGGYGTRGKGGGKAGYGATSMVGSAGTANIPMEGDADVASGLSKDQVFAVIKRHMAQVRYCYERGLQSSPGIAGRVPVDFTISGLGKVSIAKVKNSSLNSAQVEQCILRRLRTWKFPLPAGGTDVKVVFPFILKRTNKS